VKVATIVGARPQFVKAAVVSRAFGEHPKAVQEVLIHTGQHYDANMSKVFFEELDIPKPAYNLGIGGGTHGQNTGRMIEQIEQVLLTERPDWVLVYGDTDSTLAGALAAVKLHIPVAHVEAGLRSFNRRMPEEINRVLTDHAADLLFTPTDTATRNLANEGIPEDRVRQVGDVMYDAALFYAARAEARSRSLEQIGLAPKRYVLATVHRAENTDDPARLKGIVNGFAASGADIVWPLPPADPRAASGLWARDPAQCSGHRARGLPRHGDARAPRRRDRDGFGWGAEGGVLSGCALCRSARRDGVGGASGSGCSNTGRIGCCWHQSRSRSTLWPDGSRRGQLFRCGRGWPQDRIGTVLARHGG
jgi:hypothetical protein